MNCYRFSFIGPFNQFSGCFIIDVVIVFAAVHHFYHFFDEAGDFDVVFEDVVDGDYVGEVWGC